MIAIKTIDNWLIDNFFQRIIDYCNFKIGATKFICYQFLIFVAFFCDCKIYYNIKFISFLFFSGWLLMETISNFIDSYIAIDYINKFQKENFFDLRCFVSLLWSTSLILEYFNFSIFETIFMITIIIINYVKYCSINSKYKFKKKEKKLKMPKLAFAQ